MGDYCSAVLTKYVYRRFEFMKLVSTQKVNQIQQAVFVCGVELSSWSAVSTDSYSAKMS